MNSGFIERWCRGSVQALLQGKCVKELLFTSPVVEHARFSVLRRARSSKLRHAHSSTLKHAHLLKYSDYRLPEHAHFSLYQSMHSSPVTALAFSTLEYALFSPSEHVYFSFQYMRSVHAVIQEKVYILLYRSSLHAGTSSEDVAIL